MPELILKMLLSSQRNSLASDRENIVPRNLCFMKADVRHRQKAIFPIHK